MKQAEQIQKKIIDYIYRNRVSTTEVADCLGKKGAIEQVAPINRGLFQAGPVHYIYGHSESNWSIHEQARFVSKGEIVIMDGIQVNSRALVGELVTKFLLLYRRAAAIVALGNMRDGNDLIKNNYAVWCQGLSPVGCFNIDVPESSEIIEIVDQKKRLYEGAIAVCDDTGVVVIPKEEVNEEFLRKLEKIEQQEDIWFHCIDFNKWDTFDTVCLKRYIDDKGRQSIEFEGE